MLSQNMLAMRKARGMSQEELAMKLHVVRQTISKWEKGLSVPDAEMLMRLAEVLETSVSDLLGAPIEQPDQPSVIAEQLERLNAQFAERNRRSRRIWRAVRIAFGCILVFTLLLIALNFTGGAVYSKEVQTTVVESEMLAP